MSHDLETINGITFYADSRQRADGRTDAWHGLGQSFNRTMTVPEALEAARLDGWNIRKVPAFGQDPVSGELVPIPGEFATVRTNPITGKPEGLGTVGRVYKEIQNEEMITFMTALVDESGAIIETAGSINDGRDVFMTMRFPEAMELHTIDGKIDTTDLNIAVFGNHSGEGGVSVRTTSTRVVCANTRRIALGNSKTKYTVRHTTNALAALEQARTALGLVWKGIDKFQDEAEAMIETALAEDHMRRMVDELFGASEADAARTATRRQGHVDRVMELFTTSPTIIGTGVENTRWGGLQAVTEYVDHFWPRKGEAVGVAPAKRLEGDYANLKDRAYGAFLVKA